jgi:photosystem II stability/assembly factor-like uncharacterized protein
MQFLAVGQSDSRIYLGTQSRGVLSSSDGGQTWTQGIRPELVDPAVLVIRSHPDQPDVLYAGTAGIGVLKSINGGQDWTVVNNGLMHLQILSMVLAPNDPNSVYVGTVDGGVYVTRDGGGRWTQIPNGMFNKTVTALTADPSSGAIFAGTEGGGTFRYAPPAGGTK